MQKITRHASEALAARKYALHKTNRISNFTGLAVISA
jgi:hypothetical protein